MTIAATAVINNPAYKSWNITCADADTGPTNVAHGFGVAPDFVVIVQNISLTNALAINWSYTVTSSNIALSKASATGSGGTTPGTTVVAKLIAMLPHSIMQ